MLLSILRIDAFQGQFSETYRKGITLLVSRNTRILEMNSLIVFVVLIVVLNRSFLLVSL